MTIGQKIQLLRRIRGISRADLGEELGYSKYTADEQIKMYESGDRIPRKTTVEKIAYILDMDPKAFFSDEPVQRAVQEVLWLAPEERLEVEIAMEELDGMESQLSMGRVSENELALWKFQWNANQIVEEEKSWN